MDFDIKNEHHKVSLERHIEAYLRYQGVPCVGGLEVDRVDGNSAYYSYEDENDKLRRGDVEFSAFCHPTLLEDVKIEGEYVPREFYEYPQSDDETPRCSCGDEIPF